MARVFVRGYSKAQGRTLRGVIARHVTVQNHLTGLLAGMESEAQFILDTAPTGVGNSHIETERGEVDHFLKLVDPGPNDPEHSFGREGLAAMSIEMGRGADPEGRWGHVDPVAPLQKATGLMVTNFPRSPRRGRDYPKQTTRRRKGGGKKRG